MTEKKMTHTGYIMGCDARTPKNAKALIRIRETKLYWIGQKGVKYSKKRDGATLGDWPMYRLELDSIKKLEEK